MGTYREWIEKLKDQWIGEKVIFGNKQYTVIDVDYNGALLINKKSRMIGLSTLVLAPPTSGYHFKPLASEKCVHYVIDPYLLK